MRSTDHSPRIRLSDRMIPFWLFLAILIGGVIRLFPVMTASFPVNDGGLFYTIILEMFTGEKWLPDYTTYNHADIPLIYPPLGFFLVSFLAGVFNWQIIEIMRIFPAVISILTIPALYYLANLVLNSKIQSIYAVFAFALLPTSFDWLMMEEDLHVHWVSCLGC